MHGRLDVSPFIPLADARPAHVFAPVGNDRPAVIAAGAVDVEFIATLWAVLVSP